MCGWCRITPISAPAALASLHVNAALAPAVLSASGCSCGSGGFIRIMNWVQATEGRVTVPDGPGLGREPDMEVLRRYTLNEPTVKSVASPGRPLG